MIFGGKACSRFPVHHQSDIYAEQSRQLTHGNVQVLSQSSDLLGQHGAMLACSASGENGADSRRGRGESAPRRKRARHRQIKLALANRM